MKKKVHRIGEGIGLMELHTNLGDWLAGLRRRKKGFLSVWWARQGRKQMDSYECKIRTKGKGTVAFGEHPNEINVFFLHTPSVVLADVDSLACCFVGKSGEKETEMQGMR